MKILKLTALALATSLMLAGCGSSDDDTDAGDHLGHVDTKLTEQEQAKEMIRTAKLFVSDNQEIKKAYEGASEIVTEQQQARFSATFRALNKVRRYMKAHSLSHLDATELNLLIKSNEFQDDESRLRIMPDKDFIATLDSNGKFNVSGDATIKTQVIEYHYNSQTSKFKTVVTPLDSFMVNYNGFEDATQNNTSTTTPQLNFGFDSISIGSGSEKMMLTSTKEGLKAEGTFSDKVTINDDFDWEEAQQKGIIIQKAEATLDSIKLTANDSTIIAENFTVAVMDISNTLQNGKKGVRTLPYKVAFTGHLTKGAPKTNVEISFNTTANADDVKKYIELTADDKIVEKADKYVGMTTILSLKGDVTKNNTSGKVTVIPLNFQAKLKRTARNVITLENLTASVEGKALYVEGKSNLDTDYNPTATQFIVKQNNARIVLNVDADGEFKTDDHDKLSDIMVNDKDFGDLINNKGKITAKFKDDTFEIL